MPLNERCGWRGTRQRARIDELPGVRRFPHVRPVGELPRVPAGLTSGPALCGRFERQPHQVSSWGNPGCPLPAGE